jgi:hypothetical protein
MISVERIDDREDYEERFSLLGMCDGPIRYVTYTERGESIRESSRPDLRKNMSETTPQRP